MKNDVQSCFNSVMDCNDCGEHREFTTNDLRLLILDFQQSGWAGDDISTRKGFEVTVFLCKGCAEMRERRLFEAGVQEGRRRLALVGR
jgi:hypothetical protein